MIKGAEIRDKWEFCRTPLMRQRLTYHGRLTDLPFSPDIAAVVEGMRVRNKIK